MAGSIRHLRQRGGRGRATLVVILAAQILASCGSAATGTPAGATATAPATPAAASPAAEPGSFVAFCAAIRVRLLAPPRLMPEAGMCQGNSLFLIPNIAATDVEYLTVFRYTGDARGQTAAGWGAILEDFHGLDTKSGDTAWSADSQPTPQAAQGYAGFIGRFARTDKGGVRYAGTLWAGPVAADTVAVLLQGAAGQRPTLDADMAQVLRTIDMDAG